MVIQIVRRATWEPSLDDGQYLSAFDPHPLPHGVVRLVRDPHRALRFASAAEAWEFWRQAHGTRPDGEPNRPLTAWTIYIEPLVEPVVEEEKKKSARRRN